MFAMAAMLGRLAAQLKMPRLDAYDQLAEKAREYAPASEVKETNEQPANEAAVAAEIARAQAQAEALCRQQEQAMRR
jgi:hypothetical protein